MSKKLLVIEDDADTRMLLEEIFSIEGCEVDSAENVDEAVEFLERRPFPDMILTDLNVPGAGHHGEIVEIMRDQFDGKDIPIVIISGSAELKEVASRLNVGFLQKPVDMGELMNLVR